MFLFLFSVRGCGRSAGGGWVDSYTYLLAGSLQFGFGLVAEDLRITASLL